MFEAVSNKTKTLDSSIMSIHNNGLNREKGIQRSLDKVCFKVVPGKPFKEQVLEYKRGETKAIYGEVGAFYQVETPPSIFKKRRKKHVELF